MPKAETITSPRNPLLKDVRRAIVRGALTDEGLCVAETFHLLEEALRSKCEVKTILAAESAQAAVEAHLHQRNGTKASHPQGDSKVTLLTDSLFRSLSGTDTSQGVMALVSPPVWTIDALFRSTPLVVVLDGVQDPGNAGAITRAAEAFGATGAIWVKGTVSPFNSKTLRASAGSLFRLPFVHGMDAAQARTALEQKDAALYAAVPLRPGMIARQLDEWDLTPACGFVIGNEARGVSEVLRGAAKDISIPTVGVESLNAAVAAGILLYEAQRQRAVQQ